MLALSRKVGESLVIGNNVEITILEVKGEQIKIGIDAPKSVPVYRKELYLQIQQANQEAMKQDITPEGLDALFSIVQMPKSIPVATVGINNSYNAGMLAVQMLAVGDKELKAKLVKYRKEMKEKFIAENGEGVDL